MSLRVALTIDGDASGARQALEETFGAMANAARQSGAVAQGTRSAAAEGRNLTIVNRETADSFRNAAGTIAVMHGPLGGIASRLSATATMIGRMGVAGAGLAIGLGALTFAAQGGVRAFADYERQLLTTEQVISATGQAAGRTTLQIETLSREIGFNTLAATTEVRAAAGQLLTFRSIAGDTFDRTLRASQDLAAVGFGSVSTAAVQLARALEDPEQGLSMLRRSGVSFSQAQREVIRNLMETGRTAEAQREILAQVERQVGGAGLAAAGGLAGAFDSLTEATGRWFERVGAGVADALRLSDAILGIATAIDTVNQRAERLATPGGASRARLAELEAERAGILGQREALQMPEMGAQRLGVIDREIAGLQSLVQEYDRLDRQLQQQSQGATRRAQAGIAQDRIDAEIARLADEAGAIQRTELAEQQLQAVRRAGVALDSEAGQQIAELVRQNHELAQSKEAAAKASEDAAAAWRQGRDAVAALIAEQQLELERPARDRPGPAGDDPPSGDAGVCDSRGRGPASRTDRGATVRGRGGARGRAGAALLGRHDDARPR